MMSDARVSTELPPQISPRSAWLNVLAITLLGCLVFGLGCRDRTSEAADPRQPGDYSSD
jgi:hypothetical protein